MCSHVLLVQDEANGPDDPNDQGHEGIPQVALVLDPSDGNEEELLRTRCLILSSLLLTSSDLIIICVHELCLYLFVTVTV